MQKTVYLFIVFLLCYGRFVYADDLAKKDTCKESATLALQLFKEESELFIFQTDCYHGKNECKMEELRALTTSVNALFEQTVACAHMCVYGSNPKIESAWE